MQPPPPKKNGAITITDWKPEPRSITTRAALSGTVRDSGFDYLTTPFSLPAV